MLSDDDFAAKLDGAVLLLHVTSRVKTDPHQTLLRDKGGRGFPYLAVLDAEGEVIGKPTARNADAFARLVEKAGRYVACAKRVAGGEDGATFDLILAEMALGQISTKDAKARRKKMRGLDAEQKAAFDAAMLELQVLEACSGIRVNKDRVAAGQTFFRMWRRKKVPVDPEAAALFWLHITYFAEKHKNAGLFRQAMEGYAGSAPEDASTAAELDRMQKRYQKVRS